MSAHLLGYFNLSDITLRAFLNFFHILSLLVLVTEPVRPCHKGNEATVEWLSPRLHLSTEAVHMY